MGKQPAACCSKNENDVFSAKRAQKRQPKPERRSRLVAPQRGLSKDGCDKRLAQAEERSLLVKTLLSAQANTGSLDHFLTNLQVLYAVDVYRYMELHRPHLAGGKKEEEKQCRQLYRREQRLFLVGHGQSVGCRGRWMLQREVALAASEGNASPVSLRSLCVCNYYFSAGMS